MTCSVHGDDFTAAAPKPELDRFEATLKKSYELTVGNRNRRTRVVPGKLTKPWIHIYAPQECANTDHVHPTNINAPVTLEISRNHTINVSLS